MTCTLTFKLSHLPGLLHVTGKFSNSQLSLGALSILTKSRSVFILLNKVLQFPVKRLIFHIIPQHSEQIHISFSRLTYRPVLAVKYHISAGQIKIKTNKDLLYTIELSIPNSYFIILKCMQFWFSLIISFILISSAHCCALYQSVFE